MKPFWRRCLVLGFVGLALVAAAHLAAYQLTREPPNYTRIEDGLYVGGYVSTPPPGVTAVLNLNEIADPYEVEFHRWTPIIDAPPPPSLDWLRAQVDFVAEQRAAGRTVYVHCQNGISRSALVAAAFLMEQSRWSIETALAYLRERRPGVRPNPGLMPLLEEWEEMLKKRSEVKIQ